MIHYTKRELRFGEWDDEESTATETDPDHWDCTIKRERGEKKKVRGSGFDWECVGK
jgi:hypothetical protein